LRSLWSLSAGSPERRRIADNTAEEGHGGSVATPFERGWSGHRPYTFSTKRELRRSPKRVIKFYNGRGTAEQWIKEGKQALNWTRLSCRRFRDNQVRLQLFALAYNLGNFLRQLALPRPVRTWTLTTLREKLIKIGAKVVRHAKAVTFQLAEVAVPRVLFAAILVRIGRLRAAPSSG
jgi:hypothetical protein